MPPIKNLYQTPCNGKVNWFVHTHAHKVVGCAGCGGTVIRACFFFEKWWPTPKTKTGGAEWIKDSFCAKRGFVMLSVQTTFHRLNRTYSISEITLSGEIHFIRSLHVEQYLQRSTKPAVSTVIVNRIIRQLGPRTLIWKHRANLWLFTQNTCRCKHCARRTTQSAPFIYCFVGVIKPTMGRKCRMHNMNEYIVFWRKI